MSGFALRSLRAGAVALLVLVAHAAPAQEPGPLLVAPPQPPETPKVQDQQQNDAQSSVKVTFGSTGDCIYSVPLPGKTKDNQTTYRENLPHNVFGPVKATICVTAGRVLLRVAPAQAPPSRLRMSLDSARGEHFDLVWDPLANDRLAQSTVLPAGFWRVSFRSDAIRHATSTERDLSWQWDPETGWLDDGSFVPPTTLWKTPAPDVKKVPHLMLFAPQVLKNSGALELGKVPVFFTVERLPSVSRAIEALTLRGGGTSGGPPVGSGGRSAPLGLESAAGEAVRLVGEIVLDRARKEALQRIAAQIQRKLSCRASTSPWSRTCALLEGTGLDTLISSEDLLARAAVSDVIAHELTKRHSSGKGSLQALLDVTKHGSGDLVIEYLRTGSLPPAEAQAYLAKVINAVRTSWTQDGEGKYPFTHVQPFKVGGSSVSTDAALGRAKILLGVVTAVAAHCYSVQDCDARQVSDMLRRFDQFFFVGEQVSAVTAQVEETRKWIEAWPGVERIPLEIMHVMRSDDRTFSADELRHALSVALTFREVTSCAEAESTEEFSKCLEPGSPEGAKAKNYEKAASRLRQLRALVMAAVARDWPNVALNAVSFSSDLPGDPRLWRVAAALGSLTVPTGRDLSNEEATALRQARKAAIESTIDVLTDRTGREGDWVLAFFGGARGAWLSDSGVPRPSLVLGISLDRLRTRDCFVGFHAELGLLDLGRAVSWDQGLNGTSGEFTPAGILTPTLAAGPTFDNLFFVGLQVGYSPFGGKGLIGGTLGVNIPLWDLN